jgi:hypothetical protein
MKTQTLLKQFQVLFIVFSAVQLNAGSYQSDSRTFINDQSPIFLKDLAKKVAVQIPRSRVTNFDDKKAPFVLAQSQSYQNEWGACPGVIFNTESSLPVCTAFLVKNDLLLTAGHCGLVNQSGCDNNVWAFDFIKTKIISESIASGPFAFNIKIPQPSIYRCKKIIASSYNPLADGVDFSLIQLDRPVLDRLPFKIKAGVGLVLEDKIFTIGSLGGLPLVSTEAQKLRAVSKDKITGPFTLFAKGSGGPAILEKTGEVVGIMVSSSKDYYFIDFKTEKCQRPFLLTMPWTDQIKRPDGVMTAYPYSSAIRIDALPITIKNILGVK